MTTATDAAATEVTAVDTRSGTARQGGVGLPTHQASTARTSAAESAAAARSAMPPTNHVGVEELGASGDADPEEGEEEAHPPERSKDGSDCGRPVFVEVHVSAIQ